MKSGKLPMPVFVRNGKKVTERDPDPQTPPGRPEDSRLVESIPAEKVANARWTLSSPSEK